MNIAELDVPGPTRTAVTAPFWDAVADRRLLLQHCGDCGKWVFYPRALCPHCWSQKLSWQQASGRGRLTTWSIVHRPGHPGWEPAAPYMIGVVELEEGPSMLSHLLLAPDIARLGMDLAVRFTQVGKSILPCFGTAP